MICTVVPGSVRTLFCGLFVYMKLYVLLAVTRSFDLQNDYQSRGMQKEKILLAVTVKDNSSHPSKQNQKTIGYRE